MLELTDARADSRHEIMVHARFNGRPVHFHIADSAIDDFLDQTQANAEASAEALQQHWAQFTPRLEGFVARHGEHDFLLTTEMLNP